MPLVSIKNLVQRYNINHIDKLLQAEIYTDLLTV